MSLEPPDRILTGMDVAKLFRVDPKTVARWAQQGRLISFRTPGGQRRYWESDIKAAIERNRAGAAKQQQEAP